MRNRWLSGAAVAILLVGGLWSMGCSSDEEEPQTGNEAGSGGGDNTDGGDETDSGDETDAEVDAGPDGDTEPDGGDEIEPITCGTATCNPVDATFMMLAPCCPEGLENQCGLVIPEGIGNGSCVAMDQPGSEDETCEGYNLVVGTSEIDLPGCCTAQGKCGYSTAGTQLEGLGINLGCVNPEDLGLEVDGGVQDCTYEPGDPDAGTDPDAGDEPDADTDPDAGDEPDADPNP